jgi:hypothetical protein
VEGGGEEEEEEEEPRDIWVNIDLKTGKFNLGVSGESSVNLITSLSHV